MNIDDGEVVYYKGDSGMSNPELSGLKANTKYVMTVVASEDGKTVTISVAEKK